MTPIVLGGVLVLAFAVLCDAASLSSQLAVEARPPASDKDEKKEPVLEDKWFTQYLDHFNITENREWKQRYHVIKDYYKPGGPVFLQLGGEWAIGQLLAKYAVAQYAESFNALVFELEHRFYGLSHPTSDVSTKNLTYLSTDQALADAAYFIQGMNLEYKLPKETKWVAFGGSYGANLAAWMRLKYPHLVYAAVADSGPILAKVNFFDFNNVVREALTRYDPKCVTAVQEAHSKVKELLKTTEGQKIINDKFDLCDKIDATKKDDMANLLLCLADNLSCVVQYNGTEDTTIVTVCDILFNNTVGDIIDRYAAVNALIEEDEGHECTDFSYDKYINEMKNVSWEAKKVKSSNRQWNYQTCTEFGYYQTSTEKSHLFYEDILLDWSFKQCKDIFGDTFDKELNYKGKNRTNTMYGALDCQATRVVYIYSEDDPWHALGNLETKVEQSPVIYIKGASHCAIYRGFPEDYLPESIMTAWYQVKDLVGQWCKE